MIFPKSTLYYCLIRPHSNDVNKHNQLENNWDWCEDSISLKNTLPISKNCDNECLRLQLKNFTVDGIKTDNDAAPELTTHILLFKCRYWLSSFRFCSRNSHWEFSTEITHPRNRQVEHWITRTNSLLTIFLLQTFWHVEKRVSSSNNSSKWCLSQYGTIPAFAVLRRTVKFFISTTSS